MSGLILITIAVLVAMSVQGYEKAVHPFLFYLLRRTYILSGYMSESREELEGILGFSYRSIMGEPPKVATVLLEKQFPD